jgi:hypothetical protein
MPVTQPPVVARNTQTVAGDFERRGVLEDTVGLRMGMLYDLVVPFVDAGGSFCLRWHDGLNGEGDLALTLWESMGCTSDFEEHLGELFGSEGWKEVEIIFGQSREIAL